MKRLKWLHGALIALVAVALCLGLQVGLGSAARADTAPVITGLSPDYGPTAGGTSVDISGSGFAGATAVWFGYGNPVPYTVVNDGELTATSPPGGPGVTTVWVLADGTISQDSYLANFTYLSPETDPVITRLTPAYGPTSGGNTVGIFGSDFTGATSVTFGGVAATNVTVVSDAELDVTAPAGTSGYATVTVTNPVGTTSTTSATQYLYADDPVISGVSPNSGPDSGGTPVTVTGSGFTGTTAVSFGGYAAASFTVVSDTAITAIAPANADGVVDVTVTNPAGTSTAATADQYTYTATAPVVTAVTPAAGPPGGGASVTITGTGFASGTGVSFGSAPATDVSSTSATTITALAPAGSGTVDVTVTNPSGTSATSAADQYSYSGAPTATVLFPNGGQTGSSTKVTVEGTGFVAGQTTVNFGGTVIPAASVSVQNARVLTFSSPAQAAPGTDSVSVTAPGGTTAAVPGGFTFIPPLYPVVTTVSPNSGPTTGGTVVTLTGTGFSGVTSVKFGSTAATSYTVNSDTSITATAPAAAAGTVDVTVKSSGGTSSTSTADQYTYNAPAPVCTTTITGTHSTQLTVSSGLTCLVSAKQSGSVTVAAGASLSVTHSTVNGTVTATSPGAVTYCGSTKNGTLTVSGATGAVTLGDGGTCAADTIPSLIKITTAAGAVTVNGLKVNGTLTLSGDTGGVSLSSSSVNGAVYVQSNAGPSVTVVGNTVTGSLYCTGNNPAPATTAASTP